MKRGILYGVGAVGVVVVVAVVWFYASTNIDDPVEVTAPPLTEAPSPETTEAEAATSTSAAPPTTDATEPPETTPSTVATGGEIVAGPVTYELAEGSTVSFELDEVLNGSDKRVVATNPEVAAQLSVDASDLSATQLGTVLIGAQTFETDSGNRNRAIRGPILDSTTFETIEFVPTTIEGLEGTAAIGDLFEFTVIGDLTIRDVTTSVTFTVSAAFADATTIQGTGETTVSREAYGLQIPSVPAVANVSDEVLLKIDFVAAPVA